MRGPWAQFVRTGISVAVGISLVGATAIASAATTSSQGPINVGAIFALSGPASPFGIARLEGVETAVYDINHDGGILGRQVNLISANTAGDPVDAVAVVRKMLATDNISMATGLTVVDWQDALPIFDQAHMVIFDHVPSPSIDHTLFPYAFRAVPSDGLEGAAMVAYAHVRHFTKVALVFDASGQAQSLVPGIRVDLKKLGIQVVYNVALPISATNYEPQISQLLAAKPQVIISQMEPELAGLFFHELVSLGGAHVPVIGSDTTASAEWVKAAGAAEAARAIVSVQPAGNLAGAAAGPFVGTFQKLFHQAPRSNSGNGYDGMTVGALAMQAAGSTNPRVYVKYIMAVTTPGPGHVTCYSFKACKALLVAGKKIKYSGVASPMTYNKYHAISGAFEAVQVQINGNVKVLAHISANTVDKLIQ